MADNDDQAQKLIDALAPKIAEAILPKIAESVETQIKGIKDKNDELLEKLAKSKADDAHERLMAAVDKGLRDRLDKDGTLNFPKEGQAIRLTKADARDPVKYREAKKLAADRGVTLEISRD